jgi:hypothetical protein
MLDEFSNAAAVTHARCVLAIDPCHALGTTNAPTPKRLLGQFPQEAASCGAAATCLDVDRSKQVVGE